MKLKLNIAFGVGMALLLAGAAIAQSSGQRYRMDPTAPLDFHADGQEISGDDCITILKGRAEVTQDRTRLRADRLKIILGKSGGDCQDIARLEATGNVFYVTPIQSIRSNKAVYEPPKESAVFDGGVVAVQGKDVTSTEHLTVNTTTGNATLEGGVRGVIYPKAKSKDAPTTKAGK